MDEAQAAEVARRLLAVGDAIDEARAAIFDLGPGDQALFAGPLEEFAYRLQFEMLAEIYSLYPELRPPGEPPMISSDLRWDDVTLPESVSEAALDAIIFSVLKLRFQKTAMVIVKTMKRFSEHGLPVEAAMVGARIQALAQSSRIESAGDVRVWRHSEICLKN